MLSNRQKAIKIKAHFELYRGLILDSCEQELGDHSNWNYIRSRLLKFLSPERGLESKVIEIILDGEDDELQS